MKIRTILSTNSILSIYSKVCDQRDRDITYFQLLFSRSAFASMTYKRKKYHRGDTHLKKGWRTKRRTKDLDEINEDLKDENAQKLLNQEVDLDKPGSAQYYCVHCARYFINDTALHDHFSTKVHKRRLKALELEPYTIEESERASGKGSYVAPQKRKIETISRDKCTNDTDTEMVTQPKIAKVAA